MDRISAGGWLTQRLLMFDLCYYESILTLYAHILCAVSFSVVVRRPLVYIMPCLSFTSSFFLSCSLFSAVLAAGYLIITSCPVSMFALQERRFIHWNISYILTFERLFLNIAEIRLLICNKLCIGAALYRLTKIVSKLRNQVSIIITSWPTQTM